MDGEDEVMPEFGRKVILPNVSAKAETPTALLCVIPGKGEVWIPQGQVDDDSEVFKTGDKGKLVVSAWIASKKGID